jgi:hypothetical protein
MKIKLIVPVFGILLITSCGQKSEEKKEGNSAKAVVDKICDCTQSAGDIKQKEEELKYSNDEALMEEIFEAKEKINVCIDGIDGLKEELDKNAREIIKMAQEQCPEGAKYL